jgi:uncharacterized protein YjbJ (UPF0337 family)
MARARTVGLCAPTEKENVMSFLDKAKDKAEELMGKGKQQVGDKTGDEDLQAEGRSDEAKGDLKQAGEKFKDAL